MSLAPIAAAPLPSQNRLILYLGRALSSAITGLQAAGVPPDQVATILADVIDRTNWLVTAIANPENQLCWDLTVPGNVHGYWVMNGGPWFPGAPTIEELIGPSTGARCRAYFSVVADAEDDLSDALLAVDTAGWGEVMAAAADEARSRDQRDSGMRLPLWAWAGLAALGWWAYAN